MNRRIGRLIGIGLFAALPLGTGAAFAQSVSDSDLVPPTQGTPAPTGTGINPMPRSEPDLGFDSSVGSKKAGTGVGKVEQKDIGRTSGSDAEKATELDQRKYEVGTGQRETSKKSSDIRTQSKKSSEIQKQSGTDTELDNKGEGSQKLQEDEALKGKEATPQTKKAHKGRRPESTRQKKSESYEKREKTETIEPAKPSMENAPKEEAAPKTPDAVPGAPGELDLNK